LWPVREPIGVPSAKPRLLASTAFSRCFRRLESARPSPPAGELELISRRSRTCWRAADMREPPACQHHQHVAGKAVGGVEPSGCGERTGDWLVVDIPVGARQATPAAPRGLSQRTIRASTGGLSADACSRRGGAGALELDAANRRRAHSRFRAAAASRSTNDAMRQAERELADRVARARARARADPPTTGPVDQRDFIRLPMRERAVRAGLEWWS
jgi:hypothetical protein